MSWFFDKADKFVDVTDEWDFYFLRVDDKPASICVDLGRMKSIPPKGYEIFVYLSLEMKQARDDGLTSNEEFQVLSEIAEYIEAQAKKAGLLYVGRNTTDGRRDFCFYAGDLDKAVKALSSAMKIFPSYQYDVGGRNDAEWSVYRTFLYPSPQDMQRILNRRVLENLEKHGDDLSLPRKVDHRAYFQTEAQVLVFKSRIQAVGYEIEPCPADNEGRELFVDFFKSAAPNDIDGLVVEILEILNEVGGEYDGWGCTVV